MNGKNSSFVRIIPLGGLDGIGKNITIIQSGEDVIVIDCGVMFPGDGMPGVDFIIPDFSYIRKCKDNVRGIVITHGHEDHIGAISYLLKEVNAPIYASKLTIGLIKNRLEERPPSRDPVFIEIAPRDTAKIGSFNIEFLRVNHSIIGGVGLAIKTEIGTIIHTGDFKIDFSPVNGDVIDLYRFSQFGESGVLLLMSDSTNADREGFTKSESVLNKKLAEIFSVSKGRIIVATFASNIQRIQQVLDTAQRFNRKVVISGITMQKNIEIAHSMGYLSHKDGLILDVQEAGNIPNKNLVIIGTGSQGEPMSALARMARGTHRHFMAEKGDHVIITASVIPGNERMVNTVVNSLMKQGAEVYYDQEEDIHVSGHGSAKELKLMISMTRPKFFMPIHGEYRHLKAHAEIAKTLNIKPSRIVIGQNGDVLELTRSTFKRVDSIDISQIYVDGEEIGDLENNVIKERHIMSMDGFVMAIIVIADGMLMRQPDVIFRGFIGSKEEKIHELIQKDINYRVNKMLVDGAAVNDIKESLRTSIKKFLYKLTNRSPLIIVEVLEV